MEFLILLETINTVMSCRRKASAIIAATAHTGESLCKKKVPNGDIYKHFENLSEELVELKQALGDL